MTYEAAQDPLVDALRAIAQVEVTSALAATLGASFPAVRETRGHPFSLDLIERPALPAMFISAERAEASPAGRIGIEDEVVVVTFEYVMPATPLAKLDLRWPLLRAVWRELRKAIRAGTLSGTPVLEPAGVMRLEPASPAVAYDFAGDGSNAYPFFAGRMTFQWRPPAASEHLADLVALFANVNRVDGEPDLQPQVQAIASGPHLAHVGEITLDDATDLDTAIALANHLKTQLNAHAVSASAHVAADVALITAPDASDLASLLVLANDMQSASVSGHLSDSEPLQWHREALENPLTGADALFEVLPPPAATDLASAIYLLAVARYVFARHVDLGFTVP